MSSRLGIMLSRAMKVAGTVITYTPVSGTPVEITAIPAAEDRISGFGDTRILSDGAVFEVLKSDLATPARGDQLVFREEVFIVKSFRLIDDERLLWLLDCAPE